MIATTYDKQHGKAGTARGHCAFVGIEVSRLSPVAYDEQQVCRAVSPLCDMYLPVRTGGASRPVLFIRIAGGLCMGITRRADALAPSRLRRPALIAVHNGQHRQAIARTRWPAVQILRSPCGCALSFQQHASCQGANALEGHQRLSSSVGFNANRHSERRFADEKIQLPREQNE